MNDKVTLIIPVRKDADKLDRCLRAVQSGTLVPQVIVMDCTADPEALRGCREKFPGIRFFDLGMNPGRAHAVNTGIHITQTPYVMTLSPRLVAGKHCAERLCAALDEDADFMSAQAQILSAEDAGRISGAGWMLDLSADPVVRGAGSGAEEYSRRAVITAAQMDAAIYRMEYLEVTGILDERFYARLEDLDLGYRGVIAGFKNVCEPSAQCREMAAAPASSFYEQLETGNMEYFRYKYGLKGINLPGGRKERFRRTDPKAYIPCILVPRPRSLPCRSRTCSGQDLRCSREQLRGFATGFAAGHDRSADVGIFPVYLEKSENCANSD